MDDLESRYGTKKRKERSDKGQPRTSGGTKKAAPKVGYVERLEAQAVNGLISANIMRLYGIPNQPPDEKGTENLAKLIFELSKLPPFSYIQTGIKKVLPDAKGGASSAGVIAHALAYAKAWHEGNPLMAETIYVADNRIPNIPVIPKERVIEKLRQKAEGNTVGSRSISYEEHLASHGGMDDALAHAGNRRSGGM